MVLLDVAEVGELLRRTARADQRVGIEGGVRDHGQHAPGLRLRAPRPPRPCSRRGAAWSARSTPPAAGSARRSASRRRSSAARLAEDQLAQRLGRLLVRPEIRVVLLLDAGGAVVERRVVAGDPGVERALGILADVVVGVVRPCSSRPAWGPTWPGRCRPRRRSSPGGCCTSVPRPAGCSARPAAAWP